MENSLFMLIAGGQVRGLMSLLYGWNPQDLPSTGVPELLPGRNAFAYVFFTLPYNSSCHSVTPGADTQVLRD